MKFSKMGRARYISHLDLMHTLQRSMARCEMPLWFTEGFNQHAYISVALPLSTGYSGEWELLDFNLLTDDVPAGLLESLNATLPEGLMGQEIYALADGGMPIRDIAWSKYRITWHFVAGIPAGFVQAVGDLFAQEDIQIVKRSKRGEKEINMREYMRDFSLSVVGNDVICQTITAAGNNNMSPEYLTKAVRQYLPDFTIDGDAYHRLCVYTDDMKPFR